MKYLSWSELEVLTLKDSIELDGAWTLSKDKIDRENKDRRYGSLINNKNNWNLSLYQSLTHSTKSLDKKFGNRYSPSKALEIYGVNFNGLYVKLIDAYESEDIVSPTFTDLHQQKLGMKTVIIYRDSKSLVANYTDVLVSFDNINDYLMQIFNCESQNHKYNEKHILCDKKYICRISYKDLIFDIFIVRKNESKIFFDIKFDTNISNLDDISSMIIKLKRGLSLYYETRLEPEYIYLTNENNDLARVFLPMDIDYINGFKNYDINPIYPGAITLNTLKAVISGMFNKVYKNKLLNGFVTHNYNIIVNYLDTDHKLIDLTQAIENLYADKKIQVDDTEKIELADILINEKRRINSMLVNTKSEKLKELVSDFILKLEPTINNMKNPSKENNLKLKQKLKLFLSNYSERVIKLIEKHFKSINDWTRFIVDTRVNITHGEDRESKISNSFNYLVKTNAVLEILCRYYIFDKILNIDVCEIKLEEDLKSILNSVNLWESNIK